MEKYEETVNNRDRAMTFGRLWENSSPAPITVTSVQEHKRLSATSKKLLAVFGKVPADSIKPEHIRRYMDKRGEQSKTQANHEKAVCPAFTVGGMSEGT